MKLAAVKHFNDAKFSLYFYTYTDEEIADPENNENLFTSDKHYIGK